ncbi:hypothetical protein [Altererythrobacter sp. MF3-039]|uniref:hypothetical protein n=1 Tax=Altererythrobacter sp. MF3-039 TaxID=3252901 RepID=UPI00390C9E82
MSKITLFILIATVVLIIAAVLTDSAFVAGGSGVVLLVGLAYAYVVSKREAERQES